MISVAFRYESDNAEIILTPATNGDKEQIQFCKRHLSEKLSVRVDGDNLIVQFIQVNGDAEAH